MTPPAFADLQYDLQGQDLYEVQSTATSSRVSYDGTEHVSITKQGKDTRFEARAHYIRTSPDGRSSADADFIADLAPDGSFEDRVDDDPDFLTILNQPFAVQLDAPTLKDLQDLRGAVPFAANSPLGGGSVLHGLLRPATSGLIAGHPTVAVRFEAEGPMTGSLPGHTEGTISGTMHMDGTAYYSVENAMLLALRATLTIDARLHQNKPAVDMPVRITYLRSIRASAGPPLVKTPQ
ncbi:MAG TPA: hypothetical protein VGI19_01345 [Candidatus Cybelea sp.]